MRGGLDDMIQIIRAAGVNSLAEYIKVKAEVRAERPVRCPGKGCRRSNCFWKHTGYERKAREGDLVETVYIQRFLCKYCGLVISCLFDFLVPYLIFTAKMVAEAARCYASDGRVSYRQLSEKLGGIEGDRDGGILRPSHNQIFLWVKQVALRSRALLVAVQRFVVRANVALMSEQHLICPNRWKAFTKEKRAALDDLLRLFVQSALCCGTSSMAPGEWLHCFFLQSASIRQAIFAGREVELLAQQRA
jgi:hypothetical protein